MLRGGAAAAKFFLMKVRVYVLLVVGTIAPLFVLAPVGWRARYVGRVSCPRLRKIENSEMCHIYILKMKKKKLRGWNDFSRRATSPLSPGWKHLRPVLLHT